MNDEEIVEEIRKYYRRKICGGLELERNGEGGVTDKGKEVRVRESLSSRKSMAQMQELEQEERIESASMPRRRARRRKRFSVYSSMLVMLYIVIETW